METTKEQLENLLENVSAKEAKSRRRIFLASIIPILVAIALLYYFSSKIYRSESQVKNLNDQVKILSRTGDSLQKQLNDYHKKIDSIQGVYSSLQFGFEQDFGWTQKDVLSSDPTKIKLSQEAHVEIIKLLKEKKINVNTTIRYYTKRSDKGKIDDVLLKCGFRNIKVFTESYKDKKPTNTIHYSHDVSDDNIKVVGLSLIRAGLDVEEISPYPKRIEVKKHTSIEISGEIASRIKHHYTISDILNFHKS